MTPISDAIMSEGHGLKSCWLMGRASYHYSRGYGLGVIESLRGAIECAWAWRRNAQ